MHDVTRDALADLGPHAVGDDRFAGIDADADRERLVPAIGPLVLDGLLPEKIASNQSIRITAALPNGAVEPLIWLHQYDGRYQHPFMFRKAVRLPAGTIINGVPNDAVVGLLGH